jgi:hypothetical protein
VIRKALHRLTSTERSNFVEYATGARCLGRRIVIVPSIQPARNFLTWPNYPATFARTCFETVSVPYLADHGGKWSEDTVLENFRGYACKYKGQTFDDT